MDEENTDPLEKNQTDTLSATGQAIASMVPLVGGVLAILISETIPNQRADRVVAYLRKLERRIELLEATPEEIFSDPEKVDLIEEGAFQSARATSEERIERIVALVANQLASDDVKLIREKRLAFLLRQIDDDELLILNAYGQSMHGINSNAWDNIDFPGPAALGSTTEDADASKLYDLGQNNLLRLGLLEKRYREKFRGEQPKFDTQLGDFEHTVQISYLGQMLLRMVGLPTPFE